MFYDIKKNPQAVACGLFPRKKERVYIRMPRKGGWALTIYMIAYFVAFVNRYFEKFLYHSMENSRGFLI